MRINDINTYSDLELALMVLLDYLGSGNKRKEILGNRYKPVQELVNYILFDDTVPKGSGMDATTVRKVLNEMAPSSADYEQFIDDFIAVMEGINE